MSKSAGDTYNIFFDFRHFFFRRFHSKPLLANVAISRAYLNQFYLSLILPECLILPGTDTFAQSGSTVDDSASSSVSATKTITLQMNATGSSKGVSAGTSAPKILSGAE